MSALIKKGNNVFLEIEDKESVTGKYLLEEFNKWGYWTVVEDALDAQFIIAFHIQMSGKKGLAATVAEAHVEFMTLENQVFITSNVYSGSAAALNGFNSYKGASMILMRKYFKKEFKK